MPCLAAWMFGLFHLIKEILVFGVRVEVIYVYALQVDITINVFAVGWSEAEVLLRERVAAACWWVCGSGMGAGDDSSMSCVACSETNLRIVSATSSCMGVRASASWFSASVSPAAAMAIFYAFGVTLILWRGLALLGVGTSPKKRAVCLVVHWLRRKAGLVAVCIMPFPFSSAGSWFVVCREVVALVGAVVLVVVACPSSLS
jgi:hypothetical protein